MDKNKKTIIYAAIVLTLLFLFWNPFTRQAVLWILPLGSGIDDIVFLVLLVFGLTVVTVRVIHFHGEVLWENIKRFRFVWIVLAIVIFAVFACLIFGIYPIY